MARPKKNVDVEEKQNTDEQQKIVEEVLESVELSAPIVATNNVYVSTKSEEQEVEVELLSADERSAIEFAHKWLAHLRRQSRNVEFRKEASVSLSVLSSLLTR